MDEGFTFDLIEVGLIDANPYQPRMDFEPATVDELADDILARRPGRPATCGLLQLPAARAVAGGRYELIYGHRRLAAFLRLSGRGEKGFERLPMEIRAATDVEMIAMAWSENQQRLNLSIMDEARYLVQLRDECGWSLTKIGQQLGMPMGTVSNLVRLVNLPAKTQKELHQGEIGLGVAMELLRVTDVAQTEAAELFAEARQLSLTEVQKRVAQLRFGKQRHEVGESENSAVYEGAVAPAARALAERLEKGDQRAWGLLLKTMEPNFEANGVEDLRLQAAEMALVKAVRRAKGKTRRDARRIIGQLFTALELTPPWEVGMSTKVTDFLAWRERQPGKRPMVRKGKTGSVA